MAVAAGLEPLLTYHGHWNGGPVRASFQDIIVLTPKPVIPKHFDASHYLAINPDLDCAAEPHPEQAAIRHYLQHGFMEGRAYE